MTDFRIAEVKCLKCNWIDYIISFYFLGAKKWGLSFSIPKCQRCFNPNLNVKIIVMQPWGWYEIHQ